MPGHSKLPVLEPSVLALLGLWSQLGQLGPMALGPPEQQVLTGRRGPAVLLVLGSQLQMALGPADQQVP